MSAEWLEGLVWADVRSFVESPGEVLERVREQLGSDAALEELEARREDLGRRLAAKHVEKDRYVRAYAQGHISENEFAVYATDLNNQVENLKLLIASTQADLAQREEHQIAAKSTEAWLMTLQERVTEIEKDTEEAFEKRRQLVKLLVERIDVGRGEHGGVQVHVTYRFGPPEAPLGADILGGVQHPVEPDRAEHYAFSLGDKGCVGGVGRDPLEAPPHVLDRAWISQIGHEGG